MVPGWKNRSSQIGHILKGKNLFRHHSLKWLPQRQAVLSTDKCLPELLCENIRLSIFFQGSVIEPYMPVSPEDPCETDISMDFWLHKYIAHSNIILTRLCPFLMGTKAQHQNKQLGQWTPSLQTPDDYFHQPFLFSFSYTLPIIFVLLATISYHQALPLSHPFCWRLIPWTQSILLAVAILCWLHRVHKLIRAWFKGWLSQFTAQMRAALYLPEIFSFFCGAFFSTLLV